MQVPKRKIDWVDAVLLILFASLTFLVIPAWIPFLRKGWRLLIVATLLVLSCRREYICRKALIAFIPYAIVLFINAMSGDVYIGSTTNAINELMMVFVPTSLALYCIGGESRQFAKALVFISFGALLFEMVASFVVLERNPGIIRGLYSMAKEEDISLMYEYYRLGIVDYHMAHALPVLIPPLICRFRENELKGKIVFAMLIVACIVLTWLSESSTALMLIILMVFLGLLVRVNDSFKKQMTIISLMALFTIVLLSSENVLTGVFSAVETFVGEESIYSDKIEEIRLSLLENQTTGDLESRFAKYQRSLDLFEGSILFGSNQMPGRHSALLDKLASFGLVGFIPLILFFFFQINVIWRGITAKRRIYYLECVIAAFLMLLFKGMWVWPIFMSLFLLAPCLLTMGEKQ